MPSRRAWAPTATWTRATWTHCAQAAKVGYALIANRAVPGISAVGLPVHSDSGLLLAAVTVATTHGRMTDARVREVLPVPRGARDRRVARQ